ncbi:Cysteine synthase B [Rhizoctonia solani]|uniref:Cysteine synthase B n=1 Tax=Rhizoctonia solani TaxID=456999 RepID=A0A8H7M198_9AGAM|nr:Cysteine synthase B [Rhizoctonia solani]
MNVFSGKTALLDFYNPDKNPPLPLVELPSHPFEGDNVRIYAKMLTLLPAGNVKSLPGGFIFASTPEKLTILPRIVEYSSGNTVISLGIVSKIMGGPQVGAYISNKTSPQKMELLRFFGLDLTLFGGPAQVEPADVNGGIYAAIQDGCGPVGIIPVNTRAHRQLPKINIFAAAVGTSGTMTGTGSYLKTVRPDMVNLGPPAYDLVQTVDLPWQEVIDAAEHVSSKDSYRISLEFRSSGAFICCDQPYQYISDYFTKLDSSYFPPIYNTELLDKDLYPYGVDWILSPSDAFRLLYPAHGLQTPPTSPTELEELKDIQEPLIHAHAMVIDLRSQNDFKRAHIPGSKNLDIQCSGSKNPFKNPGILAELWEVLRQALVPGTKDMSNKSVLLVSYNEEIAYVGCSVLRKEGVKAFALGGGLRSGKRQV